MSVVIAGHPPRDWLKQEPMVRGAVVLAGRPLSCYRPVKLRLGGPQRRGEVVVVCPVQRVALGEWNHQPMWDSISR